MTQRICKSIIDYTKLFERVPKNQKKNLIAFVAKSTKYQQRVLENPECSPSIDWDNYKNKLPDLSDLFKNFQSKYDTLEIPYPEYNDCELENENDEVSCKIESFKTESKEKICEYNTELERIKNELSFDQMTMEEFCTLYPELGIQPLTRPTFWPHDRAENEAQAKATLDHHN